MAQSPLIQPDIRQQLIARMIMEGSDTSPVQHWTQGMARALKGAVGGLERGRLEHEEKQTLPAIAAILGGQPQQQAAPQAAPQPNLGPIESAPRPPTAPPARGRENIGGMPVYSQSEVNPMDVAGAGHGNAVASIESGGRYDLLGPVTRTGDRAYGKHQVMGANIPAWTREVTGNAATPQQFVANPRLQEDTFNNKFSEYINRFGSPEAASRAWFAGPGGMNDPNRRDQLGTSVANYGQRFAQAAQSHPVMAQGGVPAPQGMPQAAPQAQPQRAQIPSEIQQMIDHPNPGVKKYGAQLLQAWQTQQMKPPDHGVIGKDRHGNEVRGWINPVTGQTTPFNQVGEGPASSEAVAKLRKEVQDLPSYKNLAQAAPIYKNMLKSAPNNSKASDLNLVYGLGKIFDPGSVVREGEMVMVKNTASLPDWLVGSINALNGGAALTPETRAAILREAHIRIQSYNELYEQDTSMYRDIANDGRMNIRHVIPSFGSFEEYAPPTRPPRPPPQGQPQPAPAQAAPATTATQPNRRTIGGKNYVNINGQWFQE